MFLSLTKIESLPELFFLYERIICKRKKLLEETSVDSKVMDLESCFKRSLVSPLCIYIIPPIFKNARWYIVQTVHFLLLHNAYFVIYHKLSIDISFVLCYAEYVGAVIGTACVFAHLHPVSRYFVNFHMDRFVKLIILVYLIS